MSIRKTVTVSPSSRLLIQQISQRKRRPYSTLLLLQLQKEAAARNLLQKSA